jgi:hypothetical protein
MLRRSYKSMRAQSRGIQFGVAFHILNTTDHRTCKSKTHHDMRTVNQ